MAKVGKKAVAYDPFKGDRDGQTYDALSDALGDLDNPRKTVGTPPPSEERAVSASKVATPGGKGKPKTKAPRKAKPAAKAAAASSTGGEAHSVSRFAKRFQASRSEGAQYDAAALRLSAAVGSKVDFSKVTRTLWALYLQHEEDIIRNVTDAERELGHPGTGDSVGLALLEEDVARLINRGLLLASRRPSNLD